MSPVTARMHALLARELITECGGPREAERACRLNKSRLSELVESRPAAHGGQGLMEEACEASEEVLKLQGLVRKLLALGRPLTPRERLVVDAIVLKAQEELRDVAAEIESGGRS